MVHETRDAKATEQETELRAATDYSKAQTYKTICVFIDNSLVERHR